MDQLFSRPNTRRRLRNGPFSQYIAEIDRNVGDDLARGYARQTLKEHVFALAAFGEWLRKHDIALESVQPGMVTKFLESKFRRRWVGPKFAFVLPRLLDRLGGIGVPEPTRTHLDPLLDDFVTYLRHERGLAEATISRYKDFVCSFLAGRFGSQPAEKPDLSTLNPFDVSSHVVREARKLAHKTTLLMLSGLRAFFRYLLLRGEITRNLAGTVPKVADWRLQSIPSKALDAAQIQQLLRHCDRTTAVGRRDYAIFLLLARLGLRGGEVAHLSLDAIDWDAGEFILYGKSRRIDRLPLPKDVGEAIVAYLRNGRPLCTTRRLFVRARAPYEGFKNAAAVADVVRSGLQRAGLTPLHKGAHLLRHGLAMQMMRKGATLTEIGQLLRHQHVDTTAIYAKVDHEALKQMAFPWPEGAV